MSKRNRSIASFIVACLAVSAAVAFSVSVESRNWLWKTKPNNSSVTERSAKVVGNATAHANTLGSKSNLAPGPRALTPFTPTVTASKTDALLIDVDNDGKADPGDTLKYTVVIGATGEDATGVTFTDNVDPNTTFVAGSLRTTPLARPDSYTATGNVRIQVPAPGVLANDSDPDGVGPAISVTAGTSSSAQGGNVTMNADGSFSYNPPAGFEGSDSFTYTLNDNDTPNNTDTGTVSITVSGMIWFINNNASCPCDGRLTNPFNTLASFQAVNDGGNSGLHPAANDNIFVYESATDYVGPVTLLNGQKFIGQDATASLASIAGITLAPNSDALPATNSGNATIVNITSAGNGINLGQNNTLRGFTGGNAAIDINGNGFGTAVISDVTLNGNGQTLNLTNGTLSPAATFGSLSSTNSATTGISLTNVGGSLTTGSTTLSNPTGIGISVDTSGATLNFANTSVSGSGGTGVSLTTNTGTITFGSLGITPDANQRSLLATNNTNTITATSGTISSSGAVAVEITKASGTTPLNMSLTSVSANGGTSGIVLSGTGGSFTITGGGNTSQGGNFSGGQILNTTSHGISLNNVTNISLNNLRIDNTGDQGINGVLVDTFSFTYGTINNAGNGADESSISFDDSTKNIFGTLTVTNSNLTLTDASGIDVEQSDGTFTDVVIQNNTITSELGVTDPTPGSGIKLICNATTTTACNLPKATISGNTIGSATNAFNEAGLVIQANSVDNVSSLSCTLGIANDASNVINVTGNFFNGGGAGTPADVGFQSDRFITAALNGKGTSNFNISNNGTALNPIKNIDGVGIELSNFGAGTMSATVNSNFLSVNNGVGSAGIGIGCDSDSFAATTDNGTFGLVIDGNTVSKTDGPGIFAIARNSTCTLNTRISNNTAAAPVTTTSARAGIRVDSGSAAGNTTLCLDIHGNTTAGSTNTGTGTISPGINLRRQNTVGTNAFGIEGMAATSSPGVENYVNSLNTSTSGTFGVGGTALLSATTGFSNCSSAPNIAITPSKSESLTTSAAKSAPQNDHDTLYAQSSEPPTDQNPQRVSQEQLNWLVSVGIERWRQAGISDEDFLRMQGMTFKLGDLPGEQLATNDSTSVTVDETAAGFGWYLDLSPLEDTEFDVTVPNRERQVTEYSPAFGRIDLLTVVMRELGTQLTRGKSALEGPRGWLMRSTLGTGTRRAPAFKLGDVGKLKSAPDGKFAQVRSTNDAQKLRASDQQDASSNAPRNTRGLRNHAMRAPTSFSDVNLSIGVLPAGKTITITFNAQVKDPFPGPGAQVCNQGTVSGSNFASVLTDDPDVGGAADPTCTNIDLQADLAVTKDDSPDPVIAGNNLTYTINFINNGPNASGATVTDATPAGTTFVSASVTTGTGWGTTNPAVGGTGNVVFSKASVASGESAVFQIVVHVASSVAGGSTLNNSATAATTGGPTDPTPGNNTGNASTNVNAEADLSITKTDGETTVTAGAATQHTYTITVHNGGPSDAQAVSVSDAWPAGFTQVGGSITTSQGTCTPGAGGNFSCALGTMAAGGSDVTITVKYTVAASATPGTQTNTATVSSTTSDPSSGNNSASDNTDIVTSADVSISKTDGLTTATAGDPAQHTYTITVHNGGPSDAQGVSVSDTWPAGFTQVGGSITTSQGTCTPGAGGNFSCALGTMAAGGSDVTITVKYTVAASATPGTQTNTATVSSTTSDPSSGNNTASDNTDIVTSADVSISKTDGLTTATAGDPAQHTYTITVHNGGPSDAQGVSVSDTWPAGFTQVGGSITTSQGTCTPGAGGNFSCALGTMAAGGSDVTITVKYTVAASATPGIQTNTATVSSTTSDPSSGNNTAADNTNIVTSADVSVTKTDSPDPVVVGNNITYTITVTNNGPSDAQNLSLSDAVPANTTLVSVTTPSGWTRTDAVPTGGTGTLTFTRPTLAAGASSIFTVVVNVNAGTANGTTITNTANVSSATGDPTPGNNSATATTLVQSNADLAISKTRSPNTATIDAGNNVTYTIQVINNGPAAASSVTFSDSVPGGLEVVSQTNPGGGWTCNTLAVGSNGTITCTKATMANAETATLTVVAKVSCSDANGSTIANSSSVSAVSPSDNNNANNSSGTSFTVNNPAVTVTASVTLSQLPQNSHDLINVGLSALASGGTTNCPPGPLTVQVFGDEDDQTPTAPGEVFSPDAKDIAVSTLRLRGERVNTGNGRVYLIVVRSGSSFATVTVVVPKSSSAANVNAVIAEAAAAKAYADSHNGAAPVGYFVIGDGPIIGNKQ